MTEPYSYQGPGAYPVRSQAPGAVPALVLGILSIVMCGFLTGIPAMVMGRKAAKAVDGSQGMLEGRGLATAGFWTGLVGTVYTGLALLFVVGVFIFGAAITDSFDESCDQISDGGTTSSCS